MIFKIIKYWLLLCLFFNLAQESEKNIYFDIPWAIDDYVLFNLNLRENDSNIKTLITECNYAYKVPDSIVYKRQNGRIERAEGGKIVDLRNNNIKYWFCYRYPCNKDFNLDIMGATVCDNKFKSTASILSTTFNNGCSIILEKNRKST
ncbi:hypothetical protein U3516DRAFT_863301 [Neocallimastix sp. 'constans']